MTTEKTTKAGERTQEIRVSDEAVSYHATLRGQWSIEQIMAEFLDGYDLGDMREGEFACRVYDARNTYLGGFAAKVSGGKIANAPHVTTPHKIDWQ